MRELKRSIARTNMKDYGIKHINRKRTVKGLDGRPQERISFFAAYWKKWVGGVPR